MGTMIKMVCRTKTEQSVRLEPVYSPDPKSTNYDWWSATPAGSLDLQILNPSAMTLFEPGKEYFVHITKAENVVLQGAAEKAA